MSRIGKKVIIIPAGVEFTQAGTLLTAKGPKGQLQFSHNPNITVEVKGNEIHLTRNSDEKFIRYNACCIKQKHSISLLAPIFFS